MLDGNRRVVSSNWLLFIGLAVFLTLTACSKPDAPPYKTFASADEAGNALLEAGKSGDQNKLLAIFGPDSKELIASGDAVQDKAVVDRFVTAYGVMHRWRKMPDGSQVLLVGAENFAFPIPLKKNGPASGSSTPLPEKMRFSRAASVEMNWAPSMFAVRWPMLRPPTSHRARNNMP